MGGVLCAPANLSGERSSIERCGRIAPRPSRRIPATAPPSADCGRRLLACLLWACELSALRIRMLRSTICSRYTVESSARTDRRRVMNSPEIGNFAAISLAASSPYLPP